MQQDQYIAKTEDSWDKYKGSA